MAIQMSLHRIRGEATSPASFDFDDQALPISRIEREDTTELSVKSRWNNFPKVRVMGHGPERMIIGGTYYIEIAGTDPLEPVRRMRRTSTLLWISRPDIRRSVDHRGDKGALGDGGPWRIERVTEVGTEPFGSEMQKVDWTVVLVGDYG